MIAMEQDSQIGKRVDCEGARGTIKWVGSIPSTVGMWYGVDWDDEIRGKHDGSHNDVKYFITRFQKSGSFVRPSKVNLGIFFEEGLKSKYQSEPLIEEEVTTQLQRSIKARFVEVVGMEKVAKQQRQLSTLKTIVLDGWLIKGVGEMDLSSLLPSLRDLDLSQGLISTWQIVASIVKQLPHLRFLNVSENCLELPEDPAILKDSFCQVAHLVVNQMMSFSWEDLLTCGSMFINIKKIQMAQNRFSYLSDIPEGIFESVEEIDLGVNAFTEWSQIFFLGSLPSLKALNLNSCHFTVIEFPEVAPGGRTDIFPGLTSLMVAGNPLRCWKSVGELDKLRSLKDLIITFDQAMVSSYFLEFTVARIRNLEVLNRTRISGMEKRDFQLFYMRRFSSEYFSNGGSEDPKEEDLSLQFREEHPSYFALVKEVGAPSDDRQHDANKGGRLRDLKLELQIEFPNNADHKSFSKNFLPSTRLSKVKMMLKRHLKMNPGLQIILSYVYTKNDKQHEIKMDNDMKDLQFYSVSSGDIIRVRY